MKIVESPYFMWALVAILVVSLVLRRSDKQVGPNYVAVDAALAGQGVIRPDPPPHYLTGGEVGVPVYILRNDPQVVVNPVYPRGPMFAKPM